MNSFLQDLRFGVHMLRKNPGFALAAVLTLSLGIGSNIAIFTITSAVLLRSLPYQDPQRLVVADPHRKDGHLYGFTLNRFDLVRERSHSFSAIGVIASDNFNLTGRGEPQQVVGARVSPGFFEMLGIKPQLGRFFLPDEGQPGGKYVTVISDSLWHSRFGSTRDVVGQSLTLDSTPYTVIGVLPAGAQFPMVAPAEVWSPRYFEYSLIPPQRLRMGVGYLSSIARLAPGASMASASAEMEVLHQQYRKENPAAPDAEADMSVAVTNLQDSLVANIRGILLLLSVAVGLVLLIACANVASLLLSRALARKKEIAIRTALGASRRLIIRQLLTESVLLSLLGGILGLGLSWAATKYLATLGDSNLPQGFAITMDVRVLLFTLGVSLGTGLLFGIFPALQLSRTNVNQTLRDEGRVSTDARSRVRTKNSLVVGQVALSLVLLIGAGLLVRSFAGLMRVDAGFDPQNVLSMSVSLPTVKYADAQKQIAFFDDVLRRVSSLPGVRAAATSAALPLTPKRITPVLPEGQPEVALAERPFIIIEAISPSWFRTMRVPLRFGREFSDGDNAQSAKVVIVNETLAHRYWPNQNPVGKHLTIGRQPPAEIVGVARDVKNHGLALPADPQIYLPFPQLPWGNMNLLVRTSVDPHSVVSAVRAQISSVDADQPVTNIQTADELMDASRGQSRFIMLLLGVFSSTALILAAVGIYGVLAYTVAQRRQEISIRLALGAEKSDIVRLVVGHGLALALAGVGIGLVGALILSRVMSSFLAEILYKVGVRDLTTFALTPLLLLLIAVLASYLPARRAMKVDPNEALRNG